MKVRQVALVLLAPCVVLTSLSYGQLDSAQRAVLDDIARGGDGSAWSSLSVFQTQQLLNKAGAYMDNYMAYHLPDGLNADIIWTNHSRTAVASFPNTGYTGLGDSAAWTGHYLASLALRYSVTGESQLLGKISATLDSIDMLTRVSGRDGHLARHAIPLSRLTQSGSNYRAYYRRYGGDEGDAYLGQEAFSGSYSGADYAWLGNQQRDAYIAVNLGLAQSETSDAIAPCGEVGLPGRRGM